MIFIDAIEIDGRLASHLVGADPRLSDQLIGFRFAEFSILASVFEYDQPPMLVAVVSVTVIGGFK
jgi:hypothetical protein